MSYYYGLLYEHEYTEIISLQMEKIKLILLNFCFVFGPFYKTKL